MCFVNLVWTTINTQRCTILLGTDDRRNSGKLAAFQTPTKSAAQEHSTPAAGSNEVELLRQRLEAQQADWTLSRADNQFLQEQLEARNKLINELSEGLKGIEENQSALEEENHDLATEVSSLEAELETCQLANRDLELQIEHLRKVHITHIPMCVCVVVYRLAFFCSNYFRC